MQREFGRLGLDGEGVEVGGDRRRWVRMVRLGNDRWEGLCTEEVILNEGRWQRKCT